MSDATSERVPTAEVVRNALRSVDDPEVGMNIVDLGLIYRIDVAPQSVHVTMTMTTPACPMGGLIVDEVREAVGPLVPRGGDVEVELVWDPPWSPAMMSANAKQALGWEGLSSEPLPAAD
jgi:metal-sulfur cluster biosynthetic enzyme